VFKVTPRGLGVAVMIAGAVAILAYTLARPAAPVPAAPAAIPSVVRGADVASLSAAPRLLFKRMSGSGAPTQIELAALADPSGPRASTTLECDRMSFGGSKGICLQTRRGVLTTTFHGVVFDAHFQPVATLTLPGTPTRTRISSDGRYGAMTVFVTGAAHGYASVSFSTATMLVDMAAGKIIGDLEQFKATRDGQPFAAKDFNFWGVTFTGDSNTFYATLMSNRKTYLVRGTVDRRELTVLRENVECPSLSPNNRLIAFKKRVGSDLAPWRFYVLDLASMTERPIAAETRSIDDQLEWLDDGHVLYATTRSSQSPVTDIWVAPVSGSEPARPLVAEAENPLVVR
jgi:hypothetical protein